MISSFEGGDDGPFTVGATTATFSGGEAKSVGNFALYKTGFFSYMMEGAGTVGTIDFDGPGASTVDFWAVNGGNGQATIDVFALDDSSLLTSTDVVAGNMNEATAEFNFFGLGPIGRVDITNAPPAGMPLYRTAVDDFDFTPATAAAIPEPSSLWLALLGIGGARLWSRRSRGRGSRCRG